MVRPCVPRIFWTFTPSDLDIKHALLFYLQDEKMFLISNDQFINLKKNLITLRNRLAAYLHKNYQDRSLNETVLPGLNENTFICKRCFQANPCSIYNKVYILYWFMFLNHLCKAQEGNAEKKEQPPIQFVEERTRHLTGKDLEFFNSWERVIRLEEKEMQQNRRELWTISSSERQKLGR